MRHTLFCVGSVLVSLLLAAISLRYVTNTWLLALIYSFQVHFALAALAASLILLLVKRHWYAYMLVTVAVVLLGHGILMLKAFEAAPAAAAATSRPILRLMSFNIENDNFENGARIADAMLASGADVINILEAAPLKPEIPRLSKTYPYHIGCGVGTDGCDTLIFAKQPFLDQSVRSIGDLWPNRLVQVAIDFAGTRVNFVSVHLAKPYFDDFQVDELGDLKDIVAAIDGPLLLAGDFNSAIIDPHIQDFVRTSGLNTIFPEPSTWPIKAGKIGIAIDHVLARPPLRLTAVTQIEDNDGSNHFGLMAEIAIDR
jgi:endonuclease/exonuclease/phosphatase (EEP) superfamily protein YafD